MAGVIHREAMITIVRSGMVRGSKTGKQRDEQCCSKNAREEL